MFHSLVRFFFVLKILENVQKIIVKKERKFSKNNKMVFFFGFCKNNFQKQEPNYQ